MNKPVLNGWVWNIPFYPNHGGMRTVSSIFWYDSSNDLEFTKHTTEYQIVIPEFVLYATKEDIQYVHDNLERIVKDKELVVVSDDNGRWGLNIQNRI